jgi:hypothetical protein
MPDKADPETIEFMQDVMAGIGVNSANELADLLIRERLLRYQEARKVFRWVVGENHPDGKTTMMLLRRAGLLPD